MKKRKLTIRILNLLAFVVVLIVGLMLAGCGNMSMGFGEFTFKHIHFYVADEGHCATINKWYDGSVGIEVDTNEYDSMHLSEGTYILFEHEYNCPFCNE